MSNPNDILREIERRAMELERTKSSLERMAQVVASYYKGLVAAGVGLDQAVVLAVNMQMALMGLGARTAQRTGDDHASGRKAAGSGDDSGPGSRSPGP